MYNKSTLLKMTKTELKNHLEKHLGSYSLIMNSSSKDELIRMFFLQGLTIYDPDENLVYVTK